MLINRPWQLVVRNASGEPTGATPAPAEPPATPDSAPATPAAPQGPDLSWFPEQYRGESGPDIDGFRTHYEDLQASLNALSEHQPPESPDAYAFDVPDDLDFGDIQVPEGFEFTVDKDNPLWGEVRNWMHQNRMPAEASKGLVSMLAKYEASRAAQFNAQAHAELESLGPQRAERMAKVQRAIETRVPNEKQRNALLHSLTTADAVRGLEAFLSGGSNLSTPPSPPGASTEGLTGFARLQAARGG